MSLTLPFPPLIPPGGVLPHPAYAVYGTAGNDAYGLSAPTYLVTLTGDDHVAGSAGADTVYAGDGEDYVNGAGGHDWMLGGAGSDTLYGGAGEDTVFGGSGDDFIFGDAPGDGAGGADDVLHGGSGSDRIYAGAGDDVVRGGTGADTIAGEGGDDTLFGSNDGAGDGVRDMFIFHQGYGTDTVMDYEIGVDEILLGGGLAVADIVSVSSGNFYVGARTEAGLTVEFASGDVLRFVDVFDIADITF